MNVVNARVVKIVAFRASFDNLNWWVGVDRLVANYIDHESKLLAIIFRTRCRAFPEDTDAIVALI